MNGRAALVVLLLLLGADTAASQDFGSSYALVIGVDDYGSLGLSRLSNAETDARAVERYLRAQRYQVTALIGAGDRDEARRAGSGA